MRTEAVAYAPINPVRNAADTLGMALAPTAPLPEVLERPPSKPPWYTQLIHWIADARSHRVICLVGGIWLLNAFDLMLTVLAHQQGLLQEENPIARHLLAMGIPSIVLFKIGLVLIGSYPLLRFRTARVTELGTLVILVAYALLAVHWSECYELYTLAATNDAQFAGVVEMIGRIF